MVHRRLFFIGSGLLVPVRIALCVLLRLSMTSLESRGNVSGSVAICHVEDIRDANLPITSHLGPTSGIQHRGQTSSDGIVSDGP